MKFFTVLAAIIALFVFPAAAQTRIPAKDAAKHLNETVTISDKVYSTKLIDNTGMVLLDLGGEHPNQYLTLVIKGEDRAKFTSKPDEYYKGRSVTVTGKLIDYHGKPEIVVDSPDDLKLTPDDNTIKVPVKTGN
jgi:micrococcal nuclease